MPDLTPVNQCPYRSPVAVSKAIADIVRGKIFCDLGCAEGDNLGFIFPYAKKVFGMEGDPKRYSKAQARGFEVIPGDYHKDDIPESEVYYFWPNNPKDDEYLVRKLLGNSDFKGTIIVAGEGGNPREPKVIRHLAKLGRLMTVDFDEGDGERQKGTFLLAIIEADRARALLPALDRT
jgi:hypothetical protein